MLIAVILAVSVLLSFTLDQFAAPRAIRRRSPEALALHISTFVFFACAILLATDRLLLSTFGTVALVCLMVTVSNAKYRALREPFVFSDLSLFSQLFSHPRLYLPFLSPIAIGGAVVGALLVAAAYSVERPMSPSVRLDAALAAVCCLIASIVMATRLPLTLDVSEDQRRHGFLAVFMALLLNGLRPATFTVLRRALEAGPFTSNSLSTDIDVIVVQSESYFDARKLDPAIKGSLYREFDRACGESFAHGELGVPAWGANTMRTEFSVLTGVAPERLGYARFYPYAFLRRPCASLAGWFRHAGHRTFAIHPYYAGFFGRDRAFPLLQFENFLDIDHFSRAERVGAYVSDAAVTDAIISTLNESPDKPVFIFTMTMENHGPLHLEAVQPGESSSLHTLGEGAEWRDLTAYLRHVANADAMIGRLLAYLRDRRRPALVCFYGDHVPALGHVFDKLGVSPEKSNYFIWRNFGTLTGARQDVPAEELGFLLARAATVNGAVTQIECSPD